MTDYDAPAGPKEVPIFFPSLELPSAPHTCCTGIYCVDVTHSLIYPTPATTTTTTTTTTTASTSTTANPSSLQSSPSSQEYGGSGVDEPTLRGMASISSIVAIHYRRATVITNAVVDTPDLLNVLLLLDNEDGSQNNKSKLLRLDWSKSPRLGSIVRVQAFSVYSDLVELVVVGSDGYIVVIRIALENWTPVEMDPIQVVSVPDLVDRYSNGNVVTNFGLTQERVAILDKNRVLLATNPYLLSVGLSSHQAHREAKIAAWSVELAKNPSSAAGGISSLFSSFLGGAGSLKMMALPNKDKPLDMNPVVSLCMAHNDCTTLFTLHSGGMLRRWHCPTGELLPAGVSDVPVEEMPMESEWNDEPIRMVAHSYQDGNDVTRCVALFFQTTTPSLPSTYRSPRRTAVEKDDDDDDEGTAWASRLVVAAGTIRGPNLSHAVYLPVGPLSLVGASFVGGNTPALKALIANKNGQTAFLMYGPRGIRSHTDVVQKVPQQLSRTGMLDYVAGQELWFLEYLSFPAFASFHETDVSHLQYLFRPRFCRGVGNVLPPSHARIRTALQKCVPNYSRFGASGGGGNTQQSIAVQVLNAMHEWHKSIRQTTTKKSRTLSTPSRRLLPARAPAQTPGGTHTARSFYDSLQQPQREPMDSPIPQTPDRQEARMGSKPTDPDNPAKEQLEAYKQLWQQLLIQIWQEEAIDRMPLAFSADREILLRSGTVSSLVYDASSNTASQTLLDRVGLRMLTQMGLDGELSLELHVQEQRIVHALSNCTVDVAGPTVQDVEDKLSELTEDYFGMAVSAQERYQLSQELDRNGEQSILQVHQFPWNQAVFNMTNMAVDNNNTDRIPLNVQQRLALTTMCIRQLDHARQLFLGRYLVLRGLPAGEAYVTASWLGYLRTISLLVASAQHVPNVKGFTGKTVTPSDTSPPMKRPSFDSSQFDSLLVSSGVTESTTALDAFLMFLYQDPQATLETQENFPAYRPVSTWRMGQWVEAAVSRMLDSRQLLAATRAANFPELRFIVATSSRGAAVDQPKLAIILLSPYVWTARSNSGDTGVRSRLESIAECLLLLSSNYPQETAAAMVDRAFGILQFDPHDLVEGYRRVSKLSLFAVGTTKLVAELSYAIEAVRKTHTPAFLATSDEYAKLVSLLFYKSLEAQDWDRALNACTSNPSRLQRHDHLQRLVTDMVDKGCLSSLLVMCSSGKAAEYDEFAPGLDLYGIAVETLGKMGYRDWYTHRACGSESLSDYQGALYALHTSRQEWRRAAQALDLRYVNALDALLLDESKVSGGFALDATTSAKRIKLILDDLVLASSGAYNALCLVDMIESRFIISGENGKVPTLPVSNFDEEIVTVSLKRARGHEAEEQQMAMSKDGDECRLARYRDRQDLQTRAIMAMGVRRLWADGMIDLSLTKKFLSEDDDPGRTIQVLIRELFKAGCYDLGLTLALQAEESMPGRPEGRGIFREATSYLLCDHLVPLAVGAPMEFKPSLSQILDALDAVNDAASPPVPLSRAPRIKEDPSETSLRFAAMALLERATIKYTSCEMPLAKEVADCFVVEHKSAELPHWLVSLLVHGSDPSIDAPGLFAKRPTKGSSTFLGDPLALLNIYVMAGMYHSACDLVCTVLDSKGRNPESTVMRLPEKGEMDFVPYNKIDQLYNLVDSAIENGDISGNFKAVVLAARERMVQSLNDHIGRLAISEAGLKSARVLASSF